MKTKTGSTPLEAPPRESTDFGVASCVTFGVAMACVVGGAIGATTLPQPQGGGDFQGDFGSALAYFFLIVAGGGLSAIGGVLAVVALLRSRGNATAATVGLLLNLIGAAGILWWLLSR